MKRTLKTLAALKTSANLKAPVRIACLGGAYGNVPALKACLDEAEKRQCDHLAFLGDAIGCCGHSDQTLDLLKEKVALFVAGNHEQQAASEQLTCGCNYSDSADEAVGCMAFELAIQSLGKVHRNWLKTWPDQLRIDTPQGGVLLCHGSPDRTNEFLYASQLDDGRLVAWLDQHDARVLVCTHTGLPWVRSLPQGRLAVNCGVVGKPDNDGDSAVHFAVIQCDAPDNLPDESQGVWQAQIVDVRYDAVAWARELQSEHVPDVLISPLVTGRWTSGVASLPSFESNHNR